MDLRDMLKVEPGSLQTDSLYRVEEEEAAQIIKPRFLGCKKKQPIAKEHFTSGTATLKSVILLNSFTPTAEGSCHNVMLSDPAKWWHEVGVERLYPH